MRLDVYLYENALCASRTESKGFIVDGAVTVNGKVVKKPSCEVNEGDVIDVDKSGKRFVSRGGLKLEGALDAFGIDPSGRIALDVGASSGGFTDCLLKRGASTVIAVDSGTGQLVEALRNDERVVSIEGYNARYMEPSHLPAVPSLAVMDVSFISATYIIPAVYSCLSEQADFICLIKPQFEVGRAHIGKGGVVKDEVYRKMAVDKVTDFAAFSGFVTVSVIESPIKGGDGNIEYLAHFRKGETA